jgi:hypothetical protein
MFQINLLRFLLLFVIISGGLLNGTFAQQAAQINYQAVARKVDGTPLVAQNISLRLSILEGSAMGATVYSETRQATTNNFGLFSSYW